MRGCPWLCRRFWMMHSKVVQARKIRRWLSSGLYSTLHADLCCSQHSAAMCTLRQGVLSNVWYQRSAKQTVQPRAFCVASALRTSTIVVFFLMCEIPSPSLLFAVTLWKAGKALRFLSHSYACIFEPRQHCLAICIGRDFLLLSRVKEECAAFILEIKTLLKNYMASAM